ncbi:YybH family protein [Algibacter mikhailovii]|uniref:YybH family protein n=1 Tax=Algibacter mikhailovii TaxID=425498 RepID=UPI0024952CA2|nr:nuclear transport factor 2 family protein [Algibacter mikhailovii]
MHKLKTLTKINTMEKQKSNIIQFGLIFVVSIFIISCDQKKENNELNVEVDITILEKEIESRLREYEKNLKNGDSIALGNMYMKNAEIIPSTVGRENITKAFGSYIRDSITGSSFNTTQLWGDDQLLVEEGVGTWSHANGTVVGSGRYLLVWKKDDGKWKILRDTWFPDKKK